MCDRERLCFGVSVEGGPLADDQLRAVGTAAGEFPGIVLWFEDFHAEPPVAGIDSTSRSGALPIVTWEPWSATLGSLADGDHDDHLIHWADEFSVCGLPTYLRFAHEFNGDWYPWTPAQGGTPGQFRAAWRHIHDVFDEHDAIDVRWLWCPNAVSTHDAPLAEWYPGDDYVDALALDGYNWGDAKPAGEWISPAELFDPALTELRNINADKPILIGEVACAERGGSKADWIADFVDYVAGQPEVDGFVWFEHDKETDWRIVSSPAAAAAMADALKSRAQVCEVAS